LHKAEKVLAPHLKIEFMQPKPAGVNHPSQPDIFGNWPLTTEQMAFEQMTTEQMTTE
jgi:hypothetical protein